MTNSDIKPDAFSKVPALSIIVNRVDNMLLIHLGDPLVSEKVGNAIWLAIDDVVTLQDCDLYSFHPDKDTEPDAEEGNLWSFYFFFFHRKLKRMIFFTSRSVSLLAPLQPEEKDSVFLMSDSDGNMMEEIVGDTLSYEQYTMRQLDF